MAKIEESITYKGRICTFKKCIGNINFYTYTEKENNDGGDIENLLLVDKSSKEVLANIVTDYGDGAYGLYFKGYTIEKE